MMYEKLRRPLLQGFGERAFQWASEAVGPVPNEAFSPSDKQKMLGILSMAAQAGENGDHGR